MALNNLPKREEYLRKKRNRKIVKYVIVFFLTILIFILFSYISHRSEIRISKIELSGGVLVTQSDLEKEALEYIKGSYVWLFPKNNAFWYPSNKLETYLKEKFKRIDIIDIKRKDFRTLSINIAERKPIAIWCDNLPEKDIIPGIEAMEDGSTINHCYFLDQNSTIFAEAPNFSGDAYFKYYGLLTKDNPIGKQYIASSTEFSEISNFVTLVKKLSIKPLHIIAKENNEFSLVMFGGGKLYFDTKEPMSQVFENLEALMRTPEFSKTSIENMSLDYIDLRFGNKLFYKIKE